MPKRWTKKDDRKLVELRASGWPPANIANELGRSLAAISKRVTKLGIGKRPWSKEDEDLFQIMRRGGHPDRMSASTLRRSLDDYERRVWRHESEQEEKRYQEATKHHFRPVPVSDPWEDWEDRWIRSLEKAGLSHAEMADVFDHRSTEEIASRVEELRRLDIRSRMDYWDHMVLSPNG